LHYSLHIPIARTVDSEGDTEILYDGTLTHPLSICLACLHWIHIHW
jgi:hypothetical protein